MTKLAVRLAIAAVASALSLPASAEEAPLDNTAITALLTEKTVVGDRWRQHFHADGRTAYAADQHDSMGIWQVRGDRYCSRWPPSEHWACYDMTSRTEDGATIVVWIDSEGSRTEGRIAE